MNALSLTAADILNATGGELLAGEQKGPFTGVSIDSRQTASTDLFVAIKGENHDGHGFVNDVLKKGIKGVVVQKEMFSSLQIKGPEKEWVCIGVSDTVQALGALANFHRRRFNAPVVAITGSNGKTSTKEMTANVLGRKHNVLATAGNFNNEIGLPLTLFKLTDAHQQVVLELGMNHPGEILRLGRICIPDIGVITNIGHSHLEGLGSIDAVKAAKGELLETLSPGGQAVLNADDPNVMELASRTSADIITYGEAPAARIRAASVKVKGNRVLFELVLPDDRIEIKLPVPGRFMVHNALAAAAVAHAVGLFGADIKKGLETFLPVKGRLNTLQSPGGIDIVDDTYNANPSSVKAAISTFVELARDRRRVVCLGDMLELGEFSKKLHEEIGKAIGSAPADRLYITGDFASDVAAGAAMSGMKTEHIFIGTQEEILSDMTGWLKTGDWVLVKGSRSTHMENIVKRLMEAE